MKPIILADDDSDMLYMLSGFIGDTFPGVQIDQVANGVDLTARVLNGTDYGLAITDNAMPKMSGIEATRQIRARGKTLPIILISGDSELESEATEAGATRYVTKTNITAFMKAVEDLYQRGE